MGGGFPEPRRSSAKDVRDVPENPDTHRPTYAVSRTGLVNDQSTRRTAAQIHSALISFPVHRRSRQPSHCDFRTIGY
ncbi:MAG: hypothetical protein KatS3mg104_0966 [Phycisphaerae bacterium]|nr:MAG: hypothetical protein KatS3mg104_0966 [Phycisphaerae bacterium]